jgi:GNAT superfamily N-acetyltransferase
MDDNTAPISVMRYKDITGCRLAIVNREIERIFYLSSSVQTFRDADHRRAFHWLWLGRYLAQEPDEAFVAMRGETVCGYLVGSLSDPALRAAFRELTYFVDFAPQTARFPAHLHINVDNGQRSQGIGALLISAFQEHARSMGCPGMHIVTGAGMRNVGFYEKLGFREVARAPRNGSEVVMLALGWAPETGSRVGN